MNKLFNRSSIITALGLTVLGISLSITGVGPGVIAQSADENAASGRSFVYTITNPDGPNAIAVYERNPETGELIFIQAVPTGGRGSGRLIDSQSPLVANDEGTLLFAVNPASNDISVMAINDDGTLELRNGPVSSRGVEPASLAIRGDLIYVANKGDLVDPPNYSGFFVQTGGSLKRIKRRVELAFGDNPTQVLFTRDGRQLVGIRFGSGGLDSYIVKPSGRLRLRVRLNDQGGPFAAVFNPISDDHLIVADARLPGASSYAVDAGGLIAQITEVSNRPERAACWIAASSDGARIWVSNTGTNSLSLYTLGPNGSLNLASTHSTAPYGRTPFEIALDRDNRHLYQLNVGTGSQSIHSLRLTGQIEDAGLADVGAIGLPTGSAPMGLVIVTRIDHGLK